MKSKEVPHKKYMAIQIDSKLAFWTYIYMVPTSGNSNVAICEINIRDIPL